MTIRDYRPGDFDTLCDIDHRCFPPGIAYTAEDIAMALLEPGSFALVGEEQDEIGGFVLARQERSGRGHIITIDVVTEQRRSGLGTLLLEASHRRLEKLGAKRVVLEVAVSNTPAIAFYSKHGYATQRRLRNYYLDSEDAWQMMKEL